MTPQKRIMDLVLAILLAVILALPILVIAVLILVRDGRPVFYVSERMRAPGRPFGLYKFRTMSPDAGDDAASGGYKSARITPIGAVLRRYRLDELPQLLNVFKGDMSFVGPRPPLRRYVEMFPDLYGEVLKARPGITGLATLVFHAREEALLAGCTTPEENESVYVSRCIPVKARLDMIYRHNRSLCFDGVLMLATVAKPVRIRPKK